MIIHTILIIALFFSFSQISKQWLMYCSLSNPAHLI